MVSGLGKLDPRWMNLFIRDKEPGDGKRNSIKCQPAEWQVAFDRTFSLIACISLRDLFIKRILHFKISGGVWVASGYLFCLDWGCWNVDLKNYQAPQRYSCFYQDTAFSWLLGLAVPLILPVPKLYPKFGKCLHVSGEKSPNFSLDSQRDLNPKESNTQHTDHFFLLLLLLLFLPPETGWISCRFVKLYVKAVLNIANN